MFRDYLLYYSFPNGVEAFSTMVTDAPNDGLPYPVLQMHQVHGDKIAVITDRDTTREDLQGYDAMMTNLPNLAIGARSADCVPILLYDSHHQAIAAVHSGWRGTVLHISQKALARMAEVYQTRAEDVYAVIGPSISAAAFQVGEEVVEAFRNSGFPMDKIYSWRGEKDGTLCTGHHLDLWAANQWLLQESGVFSERIHVSGICSYSDVRFHSARREKENKCQRTINAIRLIF